MLMNFTKNGRLKQGVKIFKKIIAAIAE